MMQQNGELCVDTKWCSPKLFFFYFFFFMVTQTVHFFGVFFIFFSFSFFCYTHILFFFLSFFFSPMTIICVCLFLFFHVPFFEHSRESSHPHLHTHHTKLYQKLPTHKKKNWDNIFFSSFFFLLFRFVVRKQKGR